MQAAFCGLSVHFPEYDILRADNRHHVSEQVAARHFVHALQVLPVMSIFGAFVFLVNAPIEEIVYRGWLQKGLAGRSGVTIAILVQGLLFGLQHMMFAGDVRGMVIYAFMFLAWGVTAGVIVHHQRRLAPMVISHWIVNIIFGVGPMLAIGFVGM